MNIAKISNIANNVSTSLRNISAFILYPVILCVILYDVVGRFLFNSPLPWGTEGSCLLLIPAIYLPCAAVEEDKSNIRLDIFYQNYRPGLKLYVDFLGKAVCLMWSVILIVRSYEEIWTSFAMRESGMDVTLPFWPLRVVLTLAFAWLGIRVVLDIVKIVFTLQKKEAMTDGSN